MIISTDEKNEDGLADVVTELDSIDENAPEASINKETISDNNGGRIELDEGELPETIQGVEN